MKLKLTLPSKLLHSNIPTSISAANLISHSLSHPSPILTLNSPLPSTTMSLSPKTPTTTPCTLTLRHRRRTREKLLVIMGATGAGKSRLSIDLATKFSPSEIINSDKIQLYRGLDITTNKIPTPDRAGIPHHLLGTFSSSLDGELSPSHFRRHASIAISTISSRRHLPILVGGSNSFIYALLSDIFNPHYDPFFTPLTTTNNRNPNLRYNCCFLWVDVSQPVLDEYLIKRVDEMLASGMVDELAKYYNSGEVDESKPGIGLRKAIGVPEFERYFRNNLGGNNVISREEDEEKNLYEEAVKNIKVNTCRLAKRQVEKIKRLKTMGWELNRLDATEVFRAVLDERSHEVFMAAWENHVLQPSIKFVKRFMEE